MYQGFWSMHIRFEDSITTQQVYNYSFEPIMTIDVPANAQTLELWFRNFTLSSPDTPAVCDIYESNYAANYTFAVVP